MRSEVPFWKKNKTFPHTKTPPRSHPPSDPWTLIIKTVWMFWPRNQSKMALFILSFEGCCMRRCTTTDYSNQSWGAVGVHIYIILLGYAGLCWIRITFQEPDERTTNHAASLGFSPQWRHLCCANPCFQVGAWCWSIAVCWMLGKMMDDTELPWFLRTPLRTSLRTGSLPCTKSASRICIRHCELESSSSWPRKSPASLQLLLLRRFWKTLSKIAGSCIPHSPWSSNGNQPSECKPLTRNSTQRWKMWFDNKVVQLHPRHPHTSWWRGRCHCEQPQVSAMPARQSWLRSQSFKPTCLGLNQRNALQWPVTQFDSKFVNGNRPWRLQWQNPDLSRDVRLKPTAGHLGKDDHDQCPGKPQSPDTFFCKSMERYGKTAAKSYDHASRGDRWQTNGFRQGQTRSWFGQAAPHLGQEAWQNGLSDHSPHGLFWGHLCRLRHLKLATSVQCWRKANCVDILDLKLHSYILYYKQSNTITIFINIRTRS